MINLLLIFMDTVFVYMLFQAKQQRNSNRLWRRWIMGTALAGEIIVGLLAFVESHLIPEEPSPTPSAYSQPSSLT